MIIENQPREGLTSINENSGLEKQLWADEKICKISEVKINCFFLFVCLFHCLSACTFGRNKSNIWGGIIRHNHLDKIFRNIFYLIWLFSISQNSFPFISLSELFLIAFAFTWFVFPFQKNYIYIFSFFYFLILILKCSNKTNISRRLLIFVLIRKSNSNLVFNFFCKNAQRWDIWLF